MCRTLIVLYGLCAYAVFLACFAATVGFIGGLYGKTIDMGEPAPAWLAAAIDLGLITVFGLHHSVAARARAKRWLARVMAPSMERSTFVLVASLLLLLLIWQWRPIEAIVWELETPALRDIVYAVYAGGWLLVLASTFLIDHFELFGLSQVLRRWRGGMPPAQEFRTPGLYRLVRHPMHAGVLVVCWAAPTMTAGHLLFAAAMTAYIVIGSELEERDLLRLFGDAYRRYRRSTPRLVPLPRRTSVENRVGPDHGAGANRGLKP